MLSSSCGHSSFQDCETRDLILKEPYFGRDLIFSPSGRRAKTRGRSASFELKLDGEGKGGTRAWG